jgi:hypothetical protein
MSGRWLAFVLAIMFLAISPALAQTFTNPVNYCNVQAFFTTPASFACWGPVSGTPA